MNSQNVYDVIIIGGGFGGVGMAIRLKQAGYQNVLIAERSSDVGGCWRDNHYPGAACDVPSHLYSYTFEANPYWRHKFAQQSEIYAYIKHCVKKYEISDWLKFQTEILKADYQSDSKTWKLTTHQQEILTCRFLITATGQLSQPAYPSLKGKELFEGKCFHSACWDHSFDFRDKRVGVIGTGASAIQFLPRIAPKVKELVVFQRSAPYLLDKPDAVYGEKDIRRFKNMPWLMNLNRLKLFWQHECRFLAFSGSPVFMRIFRWLSMRKLKREVHRADLRKKLVPDYPMGCKRVLISNDYWPVYNLDQVVLDCSGIKEMTARGLITEEKSYELDAVIYGTGFRTTEFLTPISVTGKQGINLNDVWREGAAAYLGMTVPGFPNFFMLYGPNTNLGHNSILAMLENQISYIVQCLDFLKQQEFEEVDVKETAYKEFNVNVQNQLANTVWNLDCQSWYKNRAGKITNNWYSFVTTYKKVTRLFRDQHYHFR